METPKIGDVWFRIERVLYHNCDCDYVCHHPARPSMKVEQFYVSKITPKGVWLTLNEPYVDFERPNIVLCIDKPRWQSFDSTKRFACPDIKSAYESFLARKLSQKRILERNLHYTTALISLAKTKIESLNKEA